jgi:RHS repeat-associated protein
MQRQTGEPLQQIMLARYYEAGIGRFLSSDPGEDSSVEIPQSWNTYTYVRNNPTNNVDPDGRFLNIVAGAAIGAGLEAISEVSTSMLQGKGFVDSVKSIEVNKVIISAGVGAATSGLSALKAVGTVGKSAIAAAGNVAENAAHAEVDGEEYGVADAVTDAAVGGVVEKAAQVGSAIATAAAGQATKVEQRLSNIAASGRPRAAQTKRAVDAAKKVKRLKTAARASEAAAEPATKAIDTTKSELGK